MPVIDSVRRMALAFALIALPIAAGAQRPKVVFVCEHGTVKSVVALEYFTRLARQRGLAVDAISRGTKPDSLLPLTVRNGLTSDGFDVSAFAPRPFVRDDLRSAILVVSLDADVAPVVAGSLPVLKWDGLPSVSANYENGRTAIETRVRRLVDSLAVSKPPTRIR